MIDHDQAVGVLLTYVLPLFHLVLQSTNVEAIPKTKLILVLGAQGPTPSTLILYSPKKPLFISTLRKLFLEEKKGSLA